MTDILVGSPRVWFNDGGQSANGSANTPAEGNGLLDIGHLPNLSLEQTSEELTYDQTVSGERLQVLALNIKKTLGTTFTFDAINADNLGIILASNAKTTNTQAGGSITLERHLAPVLLDRQIFTDETDISALAITGTGGTPTYTLDTDYNLVNATRGETKILSSGSITTALPIFYNYTSAAKTRSQLLPGKDSLIEGSARIEIDITGSSLQGLAITWIIQNAVLRAEGALAIDPTAVTQGSLKMDLLVDKDVYPLQPYGKVHIG